MKKRRYPAVFFIIGFITNIIFHFFWLFVPAIILIFLGILVKPCLYIGLVLLAIDIVWSFIDQIKIRNVMLKDSDNEDFKKFQKAFFQEEDSIEKTEKFM